MSLSETEQRVINREAAHSKCVSKVIQNWTKYTPMQCKMFYLVAGGTCEESYKKSSEFDIVKTLLACPKEKMHQFGVMVAQTPIPINGYTRISK